MTNKERITIIRESFEKIVVNAGVGRASQQAQFEEKALPQFMRDLAAITGQKARIRPAKKSISGFKIREGQTVGLQITLRGKRMVDFFERLVTIVLPRVHDFKGVPRTSLDEIGALHVGFKEQMVFPEINAEESPVVFSLGATIVPKGRKKDHVVKNYQLLEFPFTK